MHLCRPTAFSKAVQWKSGRRLIFLANYQLKCIPAITNTAEDLLELARPQVPPIKQLTLKEEKIMFWGYIQYGGVQEICKQDNNTSRLKYQESLAAHYILNYKRGQILQQHGPPYTWSSISMLIKVKKVKVLQDWSAQLPDITLLSMSEVR